MNNTKHAVMITLFASMQNGAKHYTKASAHRIRELLAEYHEIQIQRRWLFIAWRTQKERDSSGGKRDITATQTELLYRFQA